MAPRRQTTPGTPPLAAIILFAGCVGLVSAADTPDGWLPKDAVPSKVSDLSGFLKSLSGAVRPLVCQYDGSRLAATTPFTHGAAVTAKGKWVCAVRPVMAAGGAMDLTVLIKLSEGVAESAGIAVAFDFAGWTVDNHVLVPAQIYGGNRFRILPMGYPPFIYDAKDRPLDMPVTTTNILHLNPDGSHAKLEMNTGNVATPMMSFHSPGLKRGFIMLSEQNTRFGNNGMMIEEDVSKKQITFAVSAPGVRSQRYTMCGRGGTGDRGADFKAGDEITLKFKLFSFACADLPEFYEQVFIARKALSGPNIHACITPYSAAADLIINHFDQHKWFEDKKYPAYSNRPGGGSQYSYQIGWNGIPVYSHPAALILTPEHLRRVSLTLDTLTHAQGKSGLFYAMHMQGRPVGDNFNECNKRPAVTMTRRTGEALYFGLKQLELLKQRGHAIKPEWEKMFRTAADALVKSYGDYGQFGQFADADTGKMEINGSTAGSVNITALVKAAAYFKHPQYLATAEKAGTLYFQRDLSNGYAGGGPCEILQSPDSESAYNLVEAYVALHEATGKAEWLKRATFAAHLFSTWMVSYDYQFPKGSRMEMAGTRAAGSIFASSQNNHSAPGLYISSGDFLLKLFRTTGDRRIGEMYQDTARNVVQYVGAPHNPLRTQSGYVTERVQLSDWEGGDIGGVNLDDSNMAWETLAALSCLENPGIYLRTDADTFIVMDHVDAKVLKRDASGVTLAITNPTKYDAKVSILAETAAQAKQPLAVTACLDWPKVEIKAGESKTFTLSSDGKPK